MKMRKKALQGFSTLLIWIFSFSATSFGAPQGTTLDLGVYKVSVDFDNGLAVRREIDVDLPLFKVKNTAEFNLGGTGGDSDESEETRKRKKREIPLEVATDEAHVRKKRDPCYGYRPSGGGGSSGTSGGGDGGSDIIEEEARRIKRKLSRKKSAKKKKIGRRRRRDVQAEDFDPEFEVENAGSKIGQTFDNVLLKVGTAWKKFVYSTEQIIREVKQAVDSFKKTPKEIENGNPQNFQSPNDADFI